jgi:hypothetical protein
MVMTSSLDAYYDDEPLWYCTMMNIINNQSPSGPANWLFA